VREHRGSETSFPALYYRDQPVDIFTFDCRLEREVVRAKVFFTRAYEHDYDHAGGIVIMDIRQAA